VKERLVENHLKKRMIAAGGICWKFTSPSVVGVPDRICVFPSGEVVFVELKAPGKTPSPMQLRRIDELRSRGAAAAWLDSKQAVDEFIDARLA
tara:strand:+ start:7653 stop:7931 length:279 start_codon:yes stop_codon:yes gene_type:complete